MFVFGSIGIRVPFRTHLILESFGMMLEPLDPYHQPREGPGVVFRAREVPGSREPRARGMPISCSGASVVLSRQRNELEPARSAGGFDAVALGLFADAPDWRI